MRRRRQLVTVGDWSVSTVHPVYEQGQQLDVYELHVFKIRGNGSLQLPLAQGGSRFQFGDGYGKRFATKEAADNYAMEHGYLQPYRRARAFPRFYCKQCRRLSHGSTHCLFHQKSVWDVDELRAKLAGAYAS